MISNFVLLFFILSFLQQNVEAAGCWDPHPKPGLPNLFPILDLTKKSPYFEFVGTVGNAKIGTMFGKMYKTTVPNQGGKSQATYTVNHLWGTYYEMGYAQGLLFKQYGNGTLQAFFDQTWNYLKWQVSNALPNFFPIWLSDLIAQFGLDVALDTTEFITRGYTDNKVYEELQGLSDGGGVDYQTLVRVHMIAGLTQGACSMYGIWGVGLQNQSSLLQLRALDWDMNGPFRNMASITVYHPNDGSNSYINIGMAGFIGGLTGISDKQLGISEIGASYSDSSFGSESRIGVPFIFLLKNILMYDVTVDDATNRMINSRRTCDLMLGVGDGKLKQFRGYQYSYSVLNVFDDTNLLPYNETWHPRIPNVVYWGMDWNCPAYNTFLSNQIKKYHGRITPEIAVSQISSVEGSGSNHLAIYDLAAMIFYASFAAPFNVTGPQKACDRQFVKYDAWALLREQKLN